MERWRPNLSRASEGSPDMSHPAFRTVGLSHISYTVKDYRMSRDFYSNLMGMNVTVDNGRPNESILTWSRGVREYLIVRSRPPGAPYRGPAISRSEGPPAQRVKPLFDHSIANWGRQGRRSRVELARGSTRILMAPIAFASRIPTASICSSVGQR
jgi:catechol 2,3-dioxygenase-like lactoylglutathione lyase family enzyme